MGVVGLPIGTTLLKIGQVVFEKTEKQKLILLEISCWKVLNELSKMRLYSSIHSLRFLLAQIKTDTKNLTLNL